VLLKFAVFLLLGVIMNVAVAWGCALCLAVPRNDDGAVAVTVSNGESWWVDMARVLSVGCVQQEGMAALRKIAHGEDGATRVSYRRGYFRNSATGARDSFGDGNLAIVRAAPWSRIGSHTSGEHRTYIDSEVAAGWPAVSLWGSVREFNGGERYVHGSWSLALPGFRQSPKGLFGVDSTLPLRPIWPGFAINSIFYAALLWALWFAPGKIRRMLRIRRGCCPACGYKIAPGVGNKCSECGHALTR
jgi:hypothetical protein